jgi:hypothetical protein
VPNEILESEITISARKLEIKGEFHFLAGISFVSLAFQVVRFGNYRIWQASRRALPRCAFPAGGRLSGSSHFEHKTKYVSQIAKKRRFQPTQSFDIKRIEQLFGADAHRWAGVTDLCPKWPR